MAKYRGTVRRNDLEGGHWQLVTDKGDAYLLEGEPLGAEGNGFLADGTKVEVVGDVDRQALSFAMTGPTLIVKSIKPA